MGIKFSVHTDGMDAVRTAVAKACARAEHVLAEQMEKDIPYNGNMALEAGKYYTQDGVLYLCNRDTGNPVYHPLSALVGLYVEVVSDGS